MSKAGGIVDEMAADKRLDVRCPADMVDHQPQGFRADALIPMRFAHPVAHQRLTLAGRGAGREPLVCDSDWFLHGTAV